MLENVTAPDADPGSEAHLLGQASLQLGDVARAVSIFRRVPGLSDNPFEIGRHHDACEPHGRSAECCARSAVEADATRAAFLTIVHMQKGQTDEALVSAQSVVEKFPDQPWSHNLLGSVLMATGQFAQARTAVSRAVEMDPKDPAALANLARVEELLGNPAAAAAAWKSILDGDPANADAAFWLARLELDQGNIPNALKVLEPFQKTSSRARLLVGSILLERGATGDVRKLAERITRDEPGNAEAWNLLGLTDLAIGATGDAAGNFRKAVELRPNGRYNLVNLARAYLAAGVTRLRPGQWTRAAGSSPGCAVCAASEFLRFLRRRGARGRPQCARPFACRPEGTKPCTPLGKLRLLLAGKPAS